MALTLSNLYKKAEKNYSLKLIAGGKGMENTVRWVHMVEDTEVPDFLHGNELVFTTGIANHQPNWLLYFVKNLKENNASGVVINLGPYVENIPPQVIVYCEQNDFPIFTIPWETRIIDITYKFCRFIIEDEKQEQSLAETFKNLIISPENKEGYIYNLEKTGFLEISEYVLISAEFLQNDENVTPRFLMENDTKIRKALRINTMAKASFVWNKRLILVYQNIDISLVEDLIKKIETILDESSNITIASGVSDFAVGYTSLSELYTKAQNALEIAKLQKKSLVSYSEIGVYKILFEVKKKELLNNYYLDNIGVLLKYDKEHNSDLCKTLRNYCENSGSINDMAELSGVHRNTINYKMKKIKDILGIELSYKNIMDIMLSFTISDILN